MILIRFALCVIAIAALRLQHWRGSDSALGKLLLGVVALLAALSYYNFVTFHAAGYIHHWETFHYHLGSKYFPELGYDGLYPASIEAQASQLGEASLPTHVRDLKTNALAPVSQLRQQRLEVKSRFSNERWESFVKDNSYFVRSTRPDYMRQIREDHGYNPSPSWTLIARLLGGWLPSSDGSLLFLTMLDPVLLLIAFICMFRTFGFRIGCASLTIFGLGYFWRFDWIGGAFLREDWLVAVVCGVCALRAQRYASAGGLFAYASMVRVFPALLLFGVGVVMIRELVRRRPLEWVKRFAAGFLLVATGMAFGGCLVGRGAPAWVEFAHNMEKHHDTWLTNNIGLEVVLLYGRATYAGAPVDPSAADHWFSWSEHMNELRQVHQVRIALAVVALCTIVALAAWRAEQAEAAVLGMVIVFALVSITSYYWVMLLLAPIRREVLALGVLWVHAVLYLFHTAAIPMEVRHAVVSWAFCFLFVVWLLPDGIRTIGRAAPSATPSGPTGPLFVERSS